MRRLGGIYCLALLGSLLLSAAGAGAQTPTSITVSPSDPMLKVGRTLQFSAQSDVTFSLGLGGALAAGEDHTCALQADGTVRCWGKNAAGQLGDGTSSNRAEPLPVAGLSGVKAIAAGAYHTCALLSDGTVKCWGSNSQGQLGDGTTTDAHTPVAVSGLSPVKAIAAGSSHTCALLSDGTLQCWGYNNKGQLGNGTTSTTPVTSPGSVQESGGSALGGAAALAAGANHTCALFPDGTVKCWGQNFFGQLGNGTTTDSATPVGVSGLSGDTPAARATAIFSSQSSLHTCVLVSEGTVECWGGNWDGQLGDGTTAGSSTPVTVSGLSEAMAIATGEAQTCALLSDSTMQCWGNNLYGQLGDGTTSRRLLPVNVLESGGGNLSGATAMAAGSVHTCALLSDGTAKCWGDNTAGKLGDGTAIGRTTPAAVVGTALPGAGATDIAVGDYHVCATLSDGTAKCWGQDWYEQVGNLTRDLKRPLPTAVYNLSGATAIAAGTYHTCALMANGTAECWGTSDLGELGTGYFGDLVSAPSSFLSVVGLTGATAIAARSENSCALVSDGTVKCWGGNAYGQLGLGYHPILRMATAATVLGPGEVGYLSGARAIAVGNLHACAVLADGTAMCWGRNNNGQLGDGTTNNAYSPVAVSGLSGAIAIAAGNAHTCALLSDGAVKCWGLNDHGQLGNGATSTTPQTTPITVAGLSGVIAIAAGGDHTAALLADGTAWGWGDNWHMQTNGSYPEVLTSPARVEIVGPLTTAAIAAGPENTCGLLQDGTAMCWGYNVYGESGTGTSDSSKCPTLVNPLVSSVAWASDLASVATINAASGLATAVALGSATITATYGELTAQTTLLVIPLSSPPTATNVSISGTPNVGSQLTGSYTYGDLDDDLEGTSTFRWLRDGTAIADATGQTYTLVSADGGHTITFEVTPVAQTGLSPGAAVTSAGVTINSVPSATGVSISGTANVGSQLTGNYTYSDVDHDAEGGTTFRWLRDGTAIEGATSSLYTPVSADAGHTITFEVTPAAQTGSSPGAAVTSAGVTINSAPTATSVSLTGLPVVGATLTGHYTYRDADEDAEGVSTFRWLRDGTAIAGAAGTTYLVVSADLGHGIAFEVTPVAQSGTSPGAAVASAGATIGSLDSIAVTPANPTLAAGATLQFTATGAYSGGSGDVTNVVSWTSSRPKSVTMAPDGLATAVKAGTSTIVARWGTLSGSTVATVGGATLNSIVVTPADATVSVGKRLQFTATGSYSDGSTRAVTDFATWTSSDPSAATIASTGVATGIAMGTATITATLGTVSGATTLTVAKALVSIAITPANPSLRVHQSTQLTATGAYSDGSTEDLTTTVAWSSSNTSVATVNAGLVTGLTAGRASIKAKLGGVTASTTVTVTR